MSNVLSPIDIVIIGTGAVVETATAALSASWNVLQLKPDSKSAIPFALIPSWFEPWLQALPELTISLRNVFAAEVSTLQLWPLQAQSPTALPLSGWVTDSNGGSLCCDVASLSQAITTHIHQERCSSLHVSEIEVDEGGTSVRFVHREEPNVAKARVVLDFRSAPTQPQRDIHHWVWGVGGVCELESIHHLIHDNTSIWIAPLSLDTVGIFALPSPKSAEMSWEILKNALEVHPATGQLFEDGHLLQEESYLLCEGFGLSFGRSRSSLHIPACILDAQTSIALHTGLLAARLAHAFLAGVLTHDDVESIATTMVNALQADHTLSAQLRSAQLRLPPAHRTHNASLQRAVAAQASARPLSHTLGGGRLAGLLSTQPRAVFLSMWPTLGAACGPPPPELRPPLVASDPLAAYVALFDVEGHQELRLRDLPIEEKVPETRTVPSDRGLVTHILDGRATVSLHTETFVAYQVFRGAFLPLPYAVLATQEILEPLALDAGFKWLTAEHCRLLKRWSTPSNAALTIEVSPNKRATAADLLLGLLTTHCVELSAIEPALSNDPIHDFDSARLNAAVEMVDRGDIASGLNELEALRSLYPLRNDLRYEVAYALRHADQREEAVLVLQKFKPEPGPISTRCATMLIALLDELERPQEAAVAYSNALEAGYDDHGLHLTAALALHRHQLSSALLALEEALRHKPTSTRAHLIGLLHAPDTRALIHGLMFTVIAPQTHPAWAIARPRLRLLLQTDTHGKDSVGGLVALIQTFRQLKPAHHPAWLDELSRLAQRTSDENLNTKARHALVNEP